MGDLVGVRSLWRRSWIAGTLREKAEGIDALSYIEEEERAALNESDLLGVEIDPDRRLAGATFRVLTLPTEGMPPEDRRVQLLLYMPLWFDLLFSLAQETLGLPVLEPRRQLHGLSQTD